jgi:uroporphyrinogen decarboxylase
MTSRERIKMALKHKEPDRVPIHDGPWESTLERWYKEGLPKDVEFEDYFGYEIRFVFPDISLQFPYEILEENDEYIVERNNYGEIVKNHKNRSTTPAIMDTAIKSRKDWEELKCRLKINKKRKLNFSSVLDFSGSVSFEEGLKRFNKNYDNGKYILYTVPAGFDLAQRYIGMERELIFIATEPDWIKDIITENAKFIIKMYEYMVDKGYKFDGIILLDDLGYRNSSLISPAHYKEIILNSDKLICDYFHDRQMDVILHSCGCVKGLIPYFIEAGIDCLNPLEVKAGMDLIELKKKYGDKLSFMGGIDTRLYSNDDPKLIEEEIKVKFKVAKENGGYIYQCDHSIPHNVSFSQYNRVMQFVGKYGKY